MPFEAFKPLSKHEQDLVSLLWSCGPLSRRDMVERTGTHPTLVGNAVSGLIRRGIARESARLRTPTPAGGRPRAPLEIDPASRHVLGIAIRPGQVSGVRLNLRGEPAGPAEVASVSGGGPGVVSAAATEIARRCTDATLCIGVTMPGFVDSQARRLLLSAASPETRGLDLSPLYVAGGAHPLTVHNDMHALSARWQLTHHAPTHEDVLLAWIADGSIGASILFGGRPNRGCITGAAELGHVQTARTTGPCFCGRSGCLERVFSSAFLGSADLWTPLGTTDDPGGITTTLATALADAANLIRPHRVVIASPFAALDRFRATLTPAVRRNLLPGLAERTTLDWWTEPAMATAETAGFLALSTLYHGGWA